MTFGMVLFLAMQLELSFSIVQDYLVDLYPGLFLVYFLMDLKFYLEKVVTDLIQCLSKK